VRNRPPPILESENDLERLFDLALDVLTIVGFDGYFKRVNPALARLLGYSTEELLSRPYSAFYHPDDLQKSRDLFASFLDAKREETIASENRVICADGTVRWLEWNTRVMPHEGRMYCVARDVTDRRGAEAELREAHRLIEESRDELRVLADELAALRRVATLVATGVPPEDVFAVVSDEVGSLVGTDSAAVIKYDDDGAGICYVGSASKVSGAFPVGVHWKFQEGMASFDVYRTGRSARSGAHLITVEGPIGEIHRQMGIVSAVASPIIVDGRLWGAVAVHGQESLPLDTERRLERFTELIATAIANAESSAGLARLVEEQSALRRVATLVARGVRADEIFAAVSEVVGRLVRTDSATIMRFDDDGWGVVFVGVASKISGAFPIGAHWQFQEGMASFDVYRTGRSARSDRQNWSNVEGPVAQTHRQLGIVSAVASPIVVEGRLWGAMAVQSQGPLPLGTEERLEKFTELIATAIANAESRAELARLAGEQAALRRVATLVARGVPPEALFAAVAEEAGQLLGVDGANMGRYEPDSVFAIVAAWDSLAAAFPIGSRWMPTGKNVVAFVLETGRPARMDTYAEASGPVGVTGREAGFRSSVGAPIVVDDRLWGAMTVASSAEQPLPVDTEARLASFTELVATAIANAESRAGLARIAEEQAALRRVATLVAEGPLPAELFSAVSEEVARLSGAGTGVLRYDHDGPAIVFVGAAGVGIPIGTRWELQEGMASAEVFETRRSARVDSMDWTATGGPVAAAARRIGVVSTVASPIVVEGLLWGTICVSSSEGPLPSDIEERLEKFTGLVSTAIANAEYRAELAASRRRIVAASDNARRRIERDLHDGIQQRLVSLGLGLRLAESSVPTELEETRRTIAGVARELSLSLDELREVSRGIHPAILAEGGLARALRTLALRSAVPVELSGEIERRLPEPIEVAAYYVVSEALTNATKHANAARVDIDTSTRDGSLRLSIRDDGIGGADPTRGSGLVGLTDRVQALGGSISVGSRPGDGTHITVELPLELTQDIDRRSGTPGTPDNEDIS
jgi:PAS domain S-box-containing protein